MIKPEDIEVPEGLTEKAREFWSFTASVESRILAALANNPIGPTKEQVVDLDNAWRKEPSSAGYAEFICTEWQRRMFLRKRNTKLDALMADPTPEKVLAAYELGKKEGK